MKEKRNVAISFAFGFIMLLTSIFIQPQNIYAAENTTQINKLLQKMKNYEWIVLAHCDERKKIKLTKPEMVKAAAFSLKVSVKNGVDKDPYHGLFDTYKISNKKLQKASQDLFGLKLSAKYLKKKEKEDSYYDAYRKTDGTPVVFYANTESDADYEVHEINIKKKSSSVYQVEKNVYLGHWMESNGQSNYKIVYQVNKSGKSKYGFIITKMEVVPLN